MAALTVDDWKWNVWELDPVTKKRKKWLGQIQDPATGFAWLRKQGLNRHKYQINNVPPETSVMPNPAYAVIATSTNQAENVLGEMLPVKPPKKGTAGSRRKTVIEEPTKRVVRSTGKGNRHLPTAKPDNSPEMRKVRKDAQVILDQHKADEVEEFGADQ